MNNIKASDKNVEMNREMLLQRSILGLSKYGTDTTDKSFSLAYWIQHAIEESLDLANYLQAILTRLNVGGPFEIGDHVRKKSGSQWEGFIVGTYSTELTTYGYAVESSTHKGSVQIYPASTLEIIDN